MLTGTLPFRGSTFVSLAAQHIVKAPAPMSDHGVEAPEHVVAALERCLAKKREDRWSTAKELAETLTLDVDNKELVSRAKPWGWLRVVAALAGAAALFGR